MVLVAPFDVFVETRSRSVHFRSICVCVLTLAGKVLCGEVDACSDDPGRPILSAELALCSQPFFLVGNSSFFALLGGFFDLFFVYRFLNLL